MGNAKADSRRGNANQAAKTERNLSIDGWRGIMAIFIAFHHMDASGTPSVFFTSYLAVEFFFILSGFLLMKKLSAMPENPADAITVPGKILFSKVKRFWTLNFLFILLLYFFSLFVKNGGGSAASLIEKFVSYFWETFFLQCSGLKVSWLNAPAWYLSALLLAGYFISVLFCLNRRLFLSIIAPLTILLNYAYLSRAAGCLGVTGLADSELAFGFISEGLVRGMAGMSVGCLLFAFYSSIEKKWQKAIVSTKQRGLISLLDLVNLAVMLKLMLFRKPSQMDFLVIPCFCIAIFFAVLRIGPCARITAVKAITFLGKISMELFLCHWFVMKVINQYLSMLSYWPKMAVFLGTAILFAAFLYYVAEPFLQKVFSSFGNYFALQKRCDLGQA